MDILGIPKNVEIPSIRLEGILDQGISFDGSSIEGFVRISESDMYLRPDLETFAVYPWSEEGKRTARLICDVYTPDGEPFSGDPRGCLRRAIAEAAELEYRMFVGPEPEFFLLHLDEQGRPTLAPQDQGSYFDLLPIDRGEGTRAEIVHALTEMGFEVEAAHHEVAPAQHEIDFHYADVLRAGDNIITFRQVAKTIALSHGLYATFMPKPIVGINGSGMHSHISLFQGERNAFYDPEDHYNLSEVAYHFMGGLIEHIEAITALANPLINSYKRLVPGFEAPVNISWARINRSALIRVPASQTPETSTRLELRSPDPSANPYLAYAAILISGLDGIRRKLEPPPPVEENIYELSMKERRERKIATLPSSLSEALTALQGDEVVRDALGEHILEKFVEAKEQELQGYRTAVSRWEIERYLQYY
ncbi:MAG: type I glutamate--ammonia ligase [Candidatus Bipolaricaulia bacterium]